MAGEGFTIVKRGLGSEGQGAPTGSSAADRYDAILGGNGNPTLSTSGANANPTAIPSRVALERLQEGRSNPTGPSAADYDKMSWGEYAPIVAGNLPSSAWNAVKGMGSAVMHPIDTVSTIGKLGIGVGSKALDAAGEAVGYGPVLDPSKKAAREQVADAVGTSYKNRYGGGEEGEFWKNLAEDPASYLADAASVMSLGAGSATKLGLLDKTGKVAKAARLAENLDPVQAAINASGKVATTTGAILPKSLMVAQSAASGLPMKTLQTARDVGLSGNPAQISALISAMKKNPNFAGDVVDQLEKAIDEMGEQASQQYMTSAATAFGRTQPVDLSLPQQARDTVEAMVDPRAMNTVLRAAPPFTPSDIQTAQAAISQLDNALTHPDPMARTIQELDVVKKNVNTLARQISDPVLRSRVQAMAGELVTAMGNTDPAYLDMMKDWTEYKRQLNNVRKDFGTERMSDAARARKLANAFKKKDGDQMFNALEGTPSGANLRYSIAGDALSDLSGDRIHNTIAGLGGPAAAALYAGFHPGVAIAAVPGLALASPKIGGYSQYALGRAQRAVNDAASGLARTAFPPVVTNIGSQVGSAMEEEPQDERIGRKAGGRVGVNHDKMAEQLVGAAERAKKGISKGTESLLDMPDDHIAQALEVANRSI